MIVRPARADDADLLLAWANDPVTRAASFRTAPIERQGHVRWLAERLSSPRTRLFIGEVDGTPVGQVRFELDDDGTATGGISVAPESRGKGYGRRLLGAAVVAVRSDPAFARAAIIARVRVENEASLRLFEGAGYRRLGVEACEGVPCVILELPP